LKVCVKKIHQQIWVKVNAPVDKNIAKLIQALSLFPKLRTIESCQGNGKQKIWVSFTYGNSWQDLSTFIFNYFGIELTKLLGDRIDIYMRVTEGGLIQAELYVCPDSLMKTVRALRTLLHKFRD
jgi:hypothetical protein